MSGTEETDKPRREDREAAPSGPVVLRAEHLRLHRDGAAFDVDIHAGELVGLAGLEGHGQQEFLEALRGAGAAEGTIVRVTDAGEVPIRSIAVGARNQIAYVPRERGRESMFGWMSIRENFGMPTLRTDAKGGWLRPSSTRRRLMEYVQRLGIVMGGPEDRITTLSGGNAQKVVIARWLAAHPKILLLNDPTRGIDINAKRDLYALLRQLTDEGMAVVMLSSEVDEHIDLMDRVLVFREGELYREMPAGELTRTSLVSAFFGDPEEMRDQETAS